MFKGLANIGTILKQAQQMGGRLQEVNEKLRSLRVSGSAGGGMVEVDANGVGEILSLRIDPQLVEKGEKELLEDLIPAAVNQAFVKAKELSGQQMQELTSGMELPGLDDAIAMFTGNGKNEP